MDNSGCQFDDCIFRSGFHFENLECQLVEMCNLPVKGGFMSENFSHWLKSPKKSCSGITSDLQIKGQLISKCLFGVIVQKNNETFLRIFALASREVKSKK